VHAISEGKEKHQDYNEKNNQEKWQINGYLFWILRSLIIHMHDK